MNFNKIIKKTLKNIVKKRNQIQAVIDFQDFIDKNGWPIAVAKDSTYKAIDHLIESKLPDMPENLVDLVIHGQVRTLPTLTKYQIEMLRKVKKIISKAKIMRCKHKIKIGVFLYGGGFSPSFTACPELICENCGLNVTIYRSSSKVIEENIGIKISNTMLNKLYGWADICLKNNKVNSANNIVADPIRALELSEKYPDKFSFKITDIKKFESLSGL